MLAQVLLRNELSFQPHNICSSLFSFMNEVLGMNVLPAFTCIYVCVPFMPGTTETRRWYWISGHWNYRWF